MLVWLNRARYPWPDCTPKCRNLKKKYVRHTTYLIAKYVLEFFLALLALHFVYFFEISQITHNAASPCGPN